MESLISITTLSPDVAPAAHKSIRAIVTLLWPYSSSTKQCALLLAEPDFRLRNRKGQVRVRFSGASAEAVARTRVGIGDEVCLELRGATWAGEMAAVVTPGRSVDGELVFRGQLGMGVKKNGTNEEVRLDVNQDTPPPEEPSQEELGRSQRLVGMRRALLEGDVYSSPAFVKRARMSGEFLLNGHYDPFAALDEEEGNAKPRKRQRTSLGAIKSWKYASSVPSPEPEAVVDNQTMLDVQAHAEDPVEKMPGGTADLTAPAEAAISPKANPAAQNAQPASPDPVFDHEPKVRDFQPLPPPRRSAARRGMFYRQSGSTHQTLRPTAAQHEGPSTPTLQPVLSSTLPLPSPFPTDGQGMPFGALNGNLTIQPPTTEQLGSGIIEAVGEDTFFPTTESPDLLPDAMDSSANENDVNGNHAQTHNVDNEGYVDHQGYRIHPEYLSDTEEDEDLYAEHLAKTSALAKARADAGTQSHAPSGPDHEMPDENDESDENDENDDDDDDAAAVCEDDVDEEIDPDSLDGVAEDADSESSEIEAVEANQTLPEVNEGLTLSRVSYQAVEEGSEQGQLQSSDAAVPAPTIDDTKHEETSINQSQTPAKRPIASFGFDGPGSATPPKTRPTPQSEKERVMAQTYRSLFGFRMLPPPAPRFQVDTTRHDGSTEPPTKVTQQTSSEAVSSSAGVARGVHANPHPPATYSGLNGRTMEGVESLAPVPASSAPLPQPVASSPHEAPEIQTHKVGQERRVPQHTINETSPVTNMPSLVDAVETVPEGHLAPDEHDGMQLLDTVSDEPAAQHAEAQFPSAILRDQQIDTSLVQGLLPHPIVNLRQSAGEEHDNEGLSFEAIKPFNPQAVGDWVHGTANAGPPETQYSFLSATSVATSTLPPTEVPSFAQSEEAKATSERTDQEPRQDRDDPEDEVMGDAAIEVDAETEEIVDPERATAPEFIEDDAESDVEPAVEDESMEVDDGSEDEHAHMIEDAYETYPVTESENESESEPELEPPVSNVAVEATIIEIGSSSQIPEPDEDLMGQTLDEQVYENDYSGFQADHGMQGMAEMEDLNEQPRIPESAAFGSATEASLAPTTIYESAFEVEFAIDPELLQGTTGPSQMPSRAEHDDTNESQTLAEVLEQANVIDLLDDSEDENDNEDESEGDAADSAEHARSSQDLDSPVTAENVTASKTHMVSLQPETSNLALPTPVDSQPQNIFRQFSAKATAREKVHAPPLTPQLTQGDSLLSEKSTLLVQPLSAEHVVENTVEKAPPRRSPRKSAAASQPPPIETSSHVEGVEDNDSIAVDIPQTQATVRRSPRKAGHQTESSQAGKDLAMSQVQDDRVLKQTPASKAPVERDVDTSSIAADSDKEKTSAKKSFTSRLSTMPDAISAWFSPRRSSRLQPSTQEAEDDETHARPEAQTVKSPQPESSTGKRVLRSAPSNGTTTSFGYYMPLSSLDEKLNPPSQSYGDHAVDVLAVVTDATQAPERAKGGPRDYFTVFHIADRNIANLDSVRVEVFRPWHATLPVAHVGDVVLLRSFAVKSRKRQAYLLSTDASAWCVWRYSNSSTGTESDEMPAWAQRSRGGSFSGVREEVKGPPVELGDDERQRVKELRGWWQQTRANPDPPSSRSADKDTIGGHNLRHRDG